ncbi:glycosyltransferase family 39 protein [Candidatus Sumerlaeota bacterium]|nr:glycosyltransferase family 39 protein [Candidatus Sumerlaeota bacterium]
MRRIFLQGQQAIFLTAVWAAAFLATWIRATAVWPEGAPGLTWDEAFYYPTFLAVRDWVGLLFSNPIVAISDTSIQAGWAQIHELPPVVKWLGAACVSIPADGWSNLVALRIFPAAANATNFLLLFLVGRKIMPAGAAVFAPLVYAALPVVQGHGQLAATETVFITVTLLTALAALQDLAKWKTKILLGVCCGLALATKVNGIILCAVVLFWLSTNSFLRARRFGMTFKHHCTAIGLVLVLAPTVALLIWPWMWHHSLDRLAEYWSFIQNHAKQGVWFEGKRWNAGGTDLPMSFPLKMIWISTPVIISVFLSMGAILLLFRACQRRSIPPAAWLLILLTIAPLAAAMLPSSPRYDGTRLFLPMFAPWVILAVKGAFDTLTWWRLRARRQAARNLRILGPNVISAIILGAWILATSHLASIDYSILQRRDMDKVRIYPHENTYWGNAINSECVLGMNQMLPHGARIKTLALQVDALRIYQQWGVLRGDLVIDPEPPYDAHLLQNRKGFWGNAEWWLYAERQPLMTWGRGPTNEPLVLLFDGRPPGVK